ncbi:MAG: hypothetical protein IPL33_14715 [Sphingobacteriales bacterium]|nr:hypothetical protein [Sphingobacteriales bacterium]MCC7223693.1 hypothetical protein [Chitinophagales bacterium]
MSKNRSKSRVNNRVKRDEAIASRFDTLHTIGQTVKGSNTKVRMRRDDAITQLANEFNLSVVTVNAILSGNYYADNTRKYTQNSKDLFDDPN